MEYWPIPFGVLQTCCKIQKYKKIIFVVFKKSMRKHIFKTSNIFYLKNVQNMLEYWSYATHKKTFILYIYIYVYVYVCICICICVCICICICMYVYVCMYVYLSHCVENRVFLMRDWYFLYKKTQKKIHVQVILPSLVTVQVN